MDAHDIKPGLAANHSIYNLNADMLLNYGFTGDRDALDNLLNRDNSLNNKYLDDATKCLLAYLHGTVANTPTNQPAAASAMNFLRGGRTAYNNGGGL